MRRSAVLYTKKGRFKICPAVIYIVATKGKSVAAMYFFVQKGKVKGFVRVLCILTALLLCLGLFPLQTSAAEEPSLYATAAVLMDADTGRVLYSKGGDVFLSNASTTKILPCRLALENADREDVVEVSAYAASMPKVKLYMKQGEHFRLEDLLYSLMLESHNDSAVAIAEHVGGSMEGFAALMNEKAKQIGCKNSWFITPNGLDATQNATDEDGNPVLLSHGTTAEDLARIMAYCAFYSPASEDFLTITRTASYTFSNQEGRTFSCTNHNAFLHMMEGALTGKTGFTNKAGYCYVGALEKDGKRFTIALLACGWPNHKTYKWSDSKALFTYGLENYTYHSLDEASYDVTILSPIPVEGGRTERFGEMSYANLMVQEGTGKGLGDMVSLAGAEHTESMTGLLLSPEEKIEVFCEVEDGLTAPVEKETVVGSIRYMVGDSCLREDLIVTQDAVLETDFFWCLSKVIRKYFFL